ncbi:CLUMA_CG000253, isoform A [Clunio marinus]|uniref:CLUMA_CG000253, isoform A n=1 Tax=Clunio marinus TaxID=568069 RepID=A0A1J1HDW2_9DIPT|nr:CLUMA_CG000253, isoform A [Clunio marinus]
MHQYHQCFAMTIFCIQTLNKSTKLIKAAISSLKSAINCSSILLIILVYTSHIRILKKRD